MAKIKLTKGELRVQQYRLGQLDKYLPTLQLKKAMLQQEVNEARTEIVRLKEELRQLQKGMERYIALLSEHGDFEPEKAVQIKEIKRRYENIAGVEVPYFESILFEDYFYNLFTTSPWVDPVVAGLRHAAKVKAQIVVATEKRIALEKELRDVSIRVNLFEKILIPRAVEHIKTIKVFLGDQQLAAVSQAKVAKRKIEERKLEKKHAEAAYAL